MKVTFVYVDVISFFKNWRGNFHFGIGQLSAILKANGYQPSLIHLTSVKIDKEEFIERIKKQSPDMLAFSITTVNFYQVKDLISWIRAAKIKVPIICGGIHATLQPTEVINTFGVDIICRGEGEYPLLELCDSMEAGKDYTAIDNLWIKNKGKIYKNPMRPLINDLDELPFVDRSIFDYPNLYEETIDKCGTMLISRGCPYKCSYCSNHALKNIYKDSGKYVRFRSVDSVIEEIKQLIHDYPFVKTLVFKDDILFQIKKWMREFVPKYKTEVGLPFVCNIRPNLVNEEIVNCLKEAGCYRTTIGLESGNDYIRNKILNRGLSDGQMRKAFNLLNQADIEIWTYNMLGIPEENASMVLDTIKMNAEFGITNYSVLIFYPFKGTKLYDLTKKKGLLTDNQVTDYFADSILKLDKLSEKQVLMFHRNFGRLVKLYMIINKFPRPLSGLMEKIADGILSSNTTAAAMEHLLRSA